MHELSLMEEVRRLALQELERHGGGRLRGLTLRIGSLAGVDPEALRFAWEVVMEEPPTTAAHLTIERVEATAICAGCERPFPCPDGLAVCPLCGAISRELRGGRELELASLELEEEESPADPGNDVESGRGAPHSGPENRG
jgi:hydrogenase nickel incorporation protein HypA/HybF